MASLIRSRIEYLTPIYNILYIQIGLKRIAILADLIRLIAYSVQWLGHPVQLYSPTFTRESNIVISIKRACRGTGGHIPNLLQKENRVTLLTTPYNPI